jgi:four helix bundle protein
MATIACFEDIQSWQRARELNRIIYAKTRSGAIIRDYEIINQVRLASLSIMSNIAEGFERDGNREFLQFLSIAKGSAGEVRSLLYVMLDAEYITQDEFKPIMSLTADVLRLIGGFMQYLQQSELKGNKRK